MTDSTPSRPESLGFKPDFARSVERFEAWWRGEVIDRPPVSLALQADEPGPAFGDGFSDLAAAWLDAEYVVDFQIECIRRSISPGDRLPILTTNVGPEVTATLLGAELTFGPTTSWSTPIVHHPTDWDNIATRQPDFDNRYWRAIEQQTRIALEKNHGRYIVGLTDLHNSYDILAALRDPERLCMDLLDEPTRVDHAARHAADVFVQALRRNYAMVEKAGLGSGWWGGYHADGPAYTASCDFWCMVGPEHARELVLPRILEEIAPMRRSVFHLDGPDALRHLDLLLDIPQLDAVQWVWGAGHGPASRWIDAYRRIRQAGKSIHLLAQTPEDALAVLQTVGPRGCWVQIEQPFASQQQAQAFLDTLDG